MTRFADPDIIACPHCEQRFLRQKLLSFNDNWQVTYSDGGAAYDLGSIVFNETRCSHCQKIIVDVQKLQSLGPVPKVPFWKRWFSQPEEYLYLPQPTSDVYFELFVQCPPEHKMLYALKAYRLFNQTYYLEDRTTKPSETAVYQYQAAAECILSTPPKEPLPEYDILCADIHRMRGDFSQANQMYAKVDATQFAPIVEQGKRWCKKQNTSLMEIQYDNAESQARSTN